MRFKIENYVDLEPTTKTYYKIINDEKVDNEIKTLCILELLCYEQITLKKAFELCSKHNIFSKDLLSLNQKRSELFDKYYEN